MLKLPVILAKVNEDLELRRVLMRDFDKVTFTVRLWEKNSNDVPIGNIHRTFSVWTQQQVDSLEYLIADANKRMLASMEKRGTTIASSEQIENAMVAELDRLRSVTPCGVFSLINHESYDVVIGDWG
jgi:hypothetical protein